MNKEALSKIIIDLHDIARRVVELGGDKNLHDDIRNCADRVNVLLKGNE